MSLQTRKGNELLEFFPEIAADLRKLSDSAIDGELSCSMKTGSRSFISFAVGVRCAIHPNRRGSEQKPGCVFAFDVLQLRGNDLRPLRLLKRKASLEKS